MVNHGDCILLFDETVDLTEETMYVGVFENGKDTSKVPFQEG